MAEIGLIAAVVQVVDVGLRLSGKLYQFGQTVASADKSIVFISKDIDLTCSILKLLEHSLKKDREARLYSENDINTAETIVKECLQIFEEMDGALLKKIKRIGLDGSSSRFAIVTLERLKWPFLKPKIMLLWSKLDKLKSSLHLLLAVLSHARQSVERTEEPSVVNDQRNMIEHLLRTTAEHSRKFESSKAAMDRDRNLEVALDATSMQIELPSKSKTNKLLETPEVDLANVTLEDYGTLIRKLVTEVEAEEYNIGHDMRRRIRDDVVHAYKRETRLLRAVHGDNEVEEKMQMKSWRLVEMAEGKTEGEQLQSEYRGESSSAAKSAPPEISGPQALNLDPCHSARETKPQKQVEVYQAPPVEVSTTPVDRGRHLTINFMTEIFVLNQESPWNHFHLLREAPIVEKPKAAEENGWLPFWRSGASMLGFNRILPLKPPKPQWPFLRSGTSMLVTDVSHDVDSIALSQDLAALTDSTDTDTFVSARSEIGEIALDSDPVFLVEAEKDGPLMIACDQGYSVLAEKMTEGWL